VSSPDELGSRSRSSISSNTEGQPASPHIPPSRQRWSFRRASSSSIRAGKHEPCDTRIPSTPRWAKRWPSESAAGLEVALDDPFQHYQFAGRADVLAWSRDERALLHVENRTRSPNLQETFGSYNTKRRYLPAIAAERLGVRRGWASVTNVVLALWSSEVLHELRIHPASFRAVCPDSIDDFATWWSGIVPPAGTPSSTFALFDPVAGSRAGRRRFVGLDAAAEVRPRYRGYADALDALGVGRRLT
jgi:hypothetical protein